MFAMTLESGSQTHFQVSILASTVMLTLGVNEPLNIEPHYVVNILLRPTHFSIKWDIALVTH